MKPHSQCENVFDLPDFHFFYCNISITSQAPDSLFSPQFIEEVQKNRPGGGASRHPDRRLHVCAEWRFRVPRLLGVPGWERLTGSCPHWPKQSLGLGEVTFSHNIYALIKLIFLFVLIKSKMLYYYEMEKSCLSL